MINHTWEAAIRVPSIGLPLDERRIVREGYRLAERMLRDYQDPPGIAATIGKWFALFRVKVPARR